MVPKLYLNISDMLNFAYFALDKLLYTLLF